jgi:alkanesulfonate monooxygenase SsuD/methylene tetrahydromethanopterin reductase-like flavin-dependent oxidoreductase (luciferase family)
MELPMLPLRLGVAYDFRNPPDSGIDNVSLYAAVLDQVAWLDQLGLDLVWFTEHHFVDDGYLPSWVPVAGAMAARTRRVRFGTDICLLPFNHPLRLAEDLAVLDNLSGGRVELGCGMGYAPHEFRGFGFPVSRRVSLTNEGIEVLKHCFSGERFSYHGRRYHFDDVRIAPGYVQEGGPPLWLAAMADGGARRAAEHRTHFLPQGPRAVLDGWRDAVIAAGDDPWSYRVGIIRGCLVTDDAERDWPLVREAERYRMRLYNRFFAESGQTGLSGAGAQIPQTWIVGDVDHCVSQLAGFVAEHGITDIVTWGVPPGLTAFDMTASLAAFATKVAPRVKALVAAGST